ncbi:hypothetical protein SAMN05444166_0308 [Singulisphaera sp. GP187]|uniref:hypothetical protein n=1 Tax=Singulisphaera sp. GP187 TaxID=1882752 RepID=UPI00092C7859|nr:hypothetical protein [Singulisphaera sp. GP187]SIN70951.1 hypothetical protein SAMN05444166_0308 [Singulisphaera sp. GP187]
MMFQTAAGDGVFATPCPRRAPRLTNVHGRRRRNALWLHATTTGLFDPGQNRIRQYTANDLAALWAVTPKAVRNGIKEALKDQERLLAHVAG